MIKIDFYDDSTKNKDNIVSDFYNIIRKGRRDSKWNQLDAWCEKYLPKTEDGIACTFEMVIKASPDKLLEYKQHLDSNYMIKNIMDELRDGHKTYYTDTLFNSIAHGCSHESAKNLLLKELSVTVCPYCNRNYIYSDKNVTSCELDHFIPKSKYPIFAVSFYNLIPVCSSCNRKKGDAEFMFYPHKMKETTDQLLKFTYDIHGTDYIKDKDCLQIKIKSFHHEYKEQIKILKLEELYSFHTDILQDILRKHEAFNDVYINNLCNEFPNLFSDAYEVKELLYGTPLQSDGYANRPLSKMTADFVREIEENEFEN